MKTKAVLFDLDKTLVDMGYADWVTARKSMAKEYIRYGVPVSIVMKYTDPYVLFAKMYSELSDIFSPNKIIKIQREVSKVLKKYEIEIITNVIRLPGCIEVLRWIKGRDARIGVISLNGERVVREALEKTGLVKFVDVSFSRDSPGRPKPFPDHVLRCLSALHSKAGNSIMVGDGIFDVVAAREAGVLAVGIPTGDNLEEELIEAGAYKTIKCLSELPPLITKMEKGPDRGSLFGGLE